MGIPIETNNSNFSDNKNHFIAAPRCQSFVSRLHFFLIPFPPPPPITVAVLRVFLPHARLPQDWPPQCLFSIMVVPKQQSVNTFSLDSSKNEITDIKQE